MRRKTPEDQRAAPRATHRAGTAFCRGPPLAPGWDPPLLLGWPPSRSSGYVFSLKNTFYNFSVIFRELLNPAQKKDTKCNSAKNSVSSGQFQTNSLIIRDKTIAKCLEKQIRLRRISSPSLAYCLSSSNSVGKLNAIKETFTNTFASQDVNILVLMIINLAST